jgi:hypothetical protein
LSFWEYLTQVKLVGISSIVNFDFDIPNRKLIIVHSGKMKQTSNSIIELNLGKKKINIETYQTDFKEIKSQKMCDG